MLGRARKSEFSVDEVREVVATVVVLTGEIDMAAKGPVTTALRTAIETAPAVIVDLCQCSFLDSTALSAFIGASRHAQAAGVPFVLACIPGGEPSRVFDLIEAHHLFAIHSSRSKALAAVDQGRRTTPR